MVSGDRPPVSKTRGSKWHAGTALVEIKASRPRGSWLSWLASEGVAESTAYRLIELTKYKTSQLGKFDSVDAALKALSGPHVSHNSGENETARAWSRGNPVTQGSRTDLTSISNLEVPRRQRPAGARAGRFVYVGAAAPG